jgi:hypothetical protein
LQATLRTVQACAEQKERKGEYVERSPTCFPLTFHGLLAIELFKMY